MEKIGYISAILLFIMTYLNSKAQTYEGLEELEGYSVKVYYSPGNEERAKIVAGRCDKTIKYVNSLVGFIPEVSLFILNQEHWEKYAKFPVYGMPHYLDDQRLVIASDDNDFWRSFIPPMEQFPKELADNIKKAYTTKENNLSMMAFFDLLALHELGHAFHEQGGLTMQRLWMQELFCNIMLHTYIAENEPENLPALEVFPEMVVAAGTEGYQFKTLADFEKRYDNMDPKNYGWYQCRLHVASKHIYNAGGSKTFVKLWNVLKSNKDKMTDEQFGTLLSNEVSSETVKVQTDW